MFRIVSMHRHTRAIIENQSDVFRSSKQILNYRDEYQIHNYYHPKYLNIWKFFASNLDF